MKKLAIHYLVVNGYANPAQAQAWVDKHGWEVVMAAAEKQERPEIVTNRRKGIQ